MTYRRCQPCDKTWYYPLDTCPFCGKGIKVLHPKCFTVQGRTEVMLASRENPKAPYFVLTTLDEHGQTHLRKSFEEYSVGHTFELPATLPDDGIFSSRISHRRADGWAALFDDLPRLTQRTDDKPINTILFLVDSLQTPPSADCCAAILDQLRLEGIAVDKVRLIDRLPANTKVEAHFAPLLQSTLSAVPLANLTESTHETLGDAPQLTDVAAPLLEADLIITLRGFQMARDRVNAPTASLLGRLLSGHPEANRARFLNNDLPFPLPPMWHFVEGEFLTLNNDRDKPRRLNTNYCFAARQFAALDHFLAALTQTESHPRLKAASYTLLREELSVMMENIVLAPTR